MYRNFRARDALTGIDGRSERVGGAPALNLKEFLTWGVWCASEGSEQH